MADTATGKHGAQPPQRKTKRANTGLKVILGVLVVCAVAGGAFWGWGTYQKQQASSKATQPTAPETSSETEAAVTYVNNPVDFSALQQQTPDAKAWIAVPGTYVNYPIVRNDSNDFFYLDHDSDGNPDISGAIFMEMQNGSGFTDPVTVVYGHNNGDNAMFASLHYFEDTTFFNDHANFYIYTPGHILTYTIVSAYQYDDRHILNTMKLTDPTTRMTYYTYVMNPDSLVKNVRVTDETKLTTDSKIVQLSTCMTSNVYDNRRYIVSGVLTNDQLTY